MFSDNEKPSYLLKFILILKSQDFEKFQFKFIFIVTVTGMMMWITYLNCCQIRELNQDFILSWSLDCRAPFIILLHDNVKWHITLPHKGKFLRFIPSLIHKLLKVLYMYVQSLSFIWYFAPWWGFLTPFDERMLPWEIDQNFCSLVKSPALVHIPPPQQGLHW